MIYLIFTDELPKGWSIPSIRMRSQRDDLLPYKGWAPKEWSTSLKRLIPKDDLLPYKEWATKGMIYSLIKDKPKGIIYSIIKDEIPKGLSTRL